jgi:hypothetical protein
MLTYEHVVRESGSPDKFHVLWQRLWVLGLGDLEFGGLFDKDEINLV